MTACTCRRGSLRGLLGHLADVLIDGDLTYADAKINSVRFSTFVSRKLFRDKIRPLALAAEGRLDLADLDFGVNVVLSAILKIDGDLAYVAGYFQFPQDSADGNFADTVFDE